MAPFTSNHHHPLGHRWLPQTPLYFPPVKIPRISNNMPRTSEKDPFSPYTDISVLPMLQKIRFCLCEAFRKVIHFCVSVALSLNMKIFFLCAGETMAMMGDSEKRMTEAQERPGQGWNSQVKVTTTVKTLAPQVKVMMSVIDTVVVKPDMMDSEIVTDWLNWETEKEQDDSDGGIDEDEYEDDSDIEWSEEDDSDWSDEEDSEVSTENEKLWESFFNSSDPYNPLYFSCPTGVKAKASDKQQKHSNPATQTPLSADQHSPEERTKKVTFSNDVTVHHLITWKFASKAARDGSCWMEQARDRERFRRRVEKAGELISPCLTAQHRARVWNRLQSLGV